MDKQVELLRQQVRAAEFLLHNLKAQLKDAEERAAGQQQPGGEEDPSPGNLPVANLPVANAGGNVEDGQSLNDIIQFEFQPGKKTKGRRHAFRVPSYHQLVFLRAY